MFPRGNTARASLAADPGASSAFFNVILQRIAAESGLPALTERVTFQFDSPAQETMFRGSLSAVLRRAG